MHELATFAMGVTVCFPLAAKFGMSIGRERERQAREWRAEPRNLVETYLNHVLLRAKR